MSCAMTAGIVSRKTRGRIFPVANRPVMSFLLLGDPAYYLTFRVYMNIIVFIFPHIFRSKAGV